MKCMQSYSFFYVKSIYSARVLNSCRSNFVKCIKSGPFFM